MNFFTRLQNGWDLAKISLRTINDNRSLLLFPVFSTLSLILVLATFAGGSFFLFGEQIEAIANSENEETGRALAIGAIFVYYLINYFVIVFFNSALIFCASKILRGEETNLTEGLAFANSRIGKIFGWAVLAATVGTLLKLLQETGKIGEFVSALIGAAWSILTFFVVPVLIFEEKGLFDTVRASGRMMREKWGESLAATTSFGFFYLIGMLLAIAIGILLLPVQPILGIILAVLIMLLLAIIASTAETVFVAAVYNRVTGAPTGNFDGDTLDGVFVTKR